MKSSIQHLTILAIAAASLSSSNAFVPSTSTTRTQHVANTELYAKGFGTPPPEPRQKSEGQVDREQKASKYDEIAATGGQEYRVFVRQFGSDDKSWLPTGSIAVPRGSQVSDAVFANEEGLRSAIVRAYPKLKGMEMEFEYGYNLKIYPDDPIEVAVKGQGNTSGPSLGNWISNLLSPVDASGVSQPSIEAKED